MLLKNKIAVAIILFLFVLRAYNMENPFSTNGIDEGIHLLQAKMVSHGYNYYEDLNGDQSPLAILVFSLFKGDVMSCRYLSYSLFIISSIILFLMAKKFGKNVAFLSLLIISLDFNLFRESRLASLDLFSAFFLLASSYFFMIYMDRKDWKFLAISSLLLSLSILSKLIPIFFVIFLLIYFIFIKRNIKHLTIYLLTFSIPFLFMLLLFTPHQMIEGIFLRQTHRGIDMYSKMSILLFISSCFVYLFSIRKWDLRDEKKLYLVSWTLFILIPIMVQGRTSQHHFVYISYPLALLSSIVINNKWNVKKRVIMTAFISFNIFLVVFFVFTAPHDISYRVADDVESITEEKDLIISGNPIVNVIANRLAPPNLTNLAKYHYPETTLNDIIYWMERNETKVVILYYHLSEIEGLREYLNMSNEWHFYEKVEGRGQLLFHGVCPKFSQDVYEIYVKG